ncbi:hypothetical protein MKEN_00083700 [Mycena kentingensis (nom. inval.)]|nr:hypothetical protein MKEN_00083700 [Mycena kentingensis (nom. inval.)]
MPKIVAKSQVSSSSDGVPDKLVANSTDMQQRTLQRHPQLTSASTVHCICGEFNLVIDKSLSALPRRRTDAATIVPTRDSAVAKARIFKLNALPAPEPILVERQGGVERQYKFSCGRCTLPIAYQTTPPPVKAGAYLYVLHGSLSQVQGQIPPEAFDGEEG